jgi:formylmethanofuran dehydrogenase subunit E-like metal-binding protein
MQKLILLLLIAPFGLFAQSNTEAKIAHQEAENQLMRRYPQAKKIDLEALNAQQKDAHKKCNTCGKKKTATSELKSNQRTMEDLLSDQQRLIVIIENLKEAENTDALLLKKYQRALTLNLEQIKTLDTTQKKQKQIALKKAAR